MLLELKYFFLWWRGIVLSAVVFLLILEWWTLDMAHHCLNHIQYEVFLLGFCFNRSHKSVGWVSLNMLPTHLGAPHGDVPRGKPIRLATPGLHVQYTHAGDRRINFLSLGFRSQDNYFPGTERTTSLSTAWLTQQPSSSFRLKKKKKKSKIVLSWPADWSDRASPTARLAQ